MSCFHAATVVYGTMTIRTNPGGLNTVSKQKHPPENIPGGAQEKTHAINQVIDNDTRVYMSGLTIFAAYRVARPFCVTKSAVVRLSVVYSNWYGA